MARDVKYYLRHAARECADRGLFFAARWAAEQLNGLSKATEGLSLPFSFGTGVSPDAGPGGSSVAPGELGDSIDLAGSWHSTDDYDRYLMAKSYFDLREYKRCAWHLRESRSPKAVFLWGYAKYLAGEKQKQEVLRAVLGQSDTITVVNEEIDSLLPRIHQVLNEMAPDDPWLLYLLGVLYKSTSKIKDAIEALVQSVKIYPFNWSAWEALSGCMTSQVVYNATKHRLPETFMKQFFMVHCILEQHYDPIEARNAMVPLEYMFGSSANVAALHALILYEERNLHDSAERWEIVFKNDPYRMEGVDTYANLLFVLDQRAQLSFLAHNAIRTDRHRHETCFAVGNLHAARNEHEKAAEAFRRAIHLNRSNGTAWVLLGHEYLELKMTEAATEAYRRAVDICPRDYRALFGLGNMYDLLELFSFAIEYFQQSLVVRPNDGRIWACLAGAYKKLGMPQEALRASKRAVSADPDYLDPNMLAMVGRLLSDQADALQLQPQARQTLRGRDSAVLYDSSRASREPRQRARSGPEHEATTSSAGIPGEDDESKETRRLRAQARTWYLRAWKHRHPALGASLLLAGDPLIDTVEALVRCEMADLRMLASAGVSTGIAGNAAGSSGAEGDSATSSSGPVAVQSGLQRCSEYIASALTDADPVHHDRIRAIQTELRELALQLQTVQHQPQCLPSSSSQEQLMGAGREPGTRKTMRSARALGQPQRDGGDGDTGSLSVVSMDMDDTH